MGTDVSQHSPEPVWVWGLPLSPLTFPESIDAVDRMIQERKPGYFITANLHYAMLTAHEPRLADVNRQAALILADGMPLVWASRWRGRRLPERVAGSDMVPALCERAAQRGYRVFLLGGAPGIADEAARRMCERFPNLQIAGIEVPPFRKLEASEEAAMLERIRTSRADILFAAFGQPKGEFWIADHCEQLGVPACVQIGASLDFLAGKVSRSPRWIQRIGFEWAYRLSREPKRLTKRYAQNAVFAIRKLIGDCFGLVLRRPLK